MHILFTQSQHDYVLGYTKEIHTTGARCSISEHRLLLFYIESHVITVLIYDIYVLFRILSDDL